jgi:hypothetical protein
LQRTSRKRRRKIAIKYFFIDNAGMDDGGDSFYDTPLNVSLALERLFRQTDGRKVTVGVGVIDLIKTKAINPL